MGSEPDWTKNQAVSPQAQPVSRAKRMTLTARKPPCNRPRWRRAGCRTALNHPARGRQSPPRSARRQVRRSHSRGRHRFVVLMQLKRCDIAHQRCDSIVCLSRHCRSHGHDRVSLSQRPGRCFGGTCAKARRHSRRAASSWSRGQDLNLRPPSYEPVYSAVHQQPLFASPCFRRHIWPDFTQFFPRNFSRNDSKLIPRGFFSRNQPQALLRQGATLLRNRCE